jgi:hypothetical protein
MIPNPFLQFDLFILPDNCIRATTSRDIDKQLPLAKDFLAGKVNPQKSQRFSSSNCIRGTTSRDIDR